MSSFVDAAQLHARAGDGGAGCVSFRREAHVARGGPDGGDGGDGGDVWLVADVNQASLLGFRDHPFRRAGDGRHGSSKRQHGASGADLEVAVPVGTVVHGPDGSVAADLATPGDRWRAAAGGVGGWGNARFLSNRRRAPGFAEQGEHGEERWYDLELKLRADVAIVGFPNVGKSTLIAAVSAARPKIADYPFTTLVPNLGVVRVGGRPSHPDDVTEFVMADIPGLVEGAAAGRGLGREFLRHVEHAKVLCLLLDRSEDAPLDPRAQYEVLLGELGDYLPELVTRPRVVVGSKGDRARGDDDTVETTVTAITGEGLRELLGRLAQLVAAARRDEADAAPAPVVHRPAPEGTVTVRREGLAWVVEGRLAERAVRLSDLTDEGALAESVHRLRALGVDRLLARAGARDGDVVQVGPVSFSWFRDAAASGLDADGHHRATQRERRARRQREGKGDDA